MKNIKLTLVLLIINSVFAITGCALNNPNKAIEDAKKVGDIKCRLIRLMEESMVSINSKAGNASGLFREATKLEADEELAKLIEKKYKSNQVSDNDRKIFYSAISKVLEECK